MISIRRLVRLVIILSMSLSTLTFIGLPAGAKTNALVSIAHQSSALSWQNETDPSSSQVTFQSISCPTSSFCAAVGAQGTIITSDNSGSTWTVNNSGATQGLTSISCATSSICVAVGYSGSIVATSNAGGSWAPITSPIQSNINGVSCPNQNTCFAVGGNGQILQGTPAPGGSWTVAANLTQLLFAIDCLSATSCVAVGLQGAIVDTSDGSTWTPLQSGTTSTLFSVSCVSVDFCVAVGGTSAVMTTNGTSWSVVNSLGTGSSTLQAVACVAPSSCWIGGINPGTVQATTDSGSTWSQQMPDSSNWIFGLSCADALHCWGVGAGVIMSGVGAPSSVNTTSPVYNADAPDPDIVVSNGTYYAFTTGTAAGNYIQLLSSSTLSAWTVVGSALPNPPGWEQVNTQEAPGVFYFGNEYIMYYAAIQASTNTRCISMATSSSVTGPYQDTSSGPMLCDPSLGGVLDPQPFIDTNGNAYLYWKSNDGLPGKNSQIWVAPIGFGGVPNFAGATSLIVQNQSNTIEGPFMYLNNGSYYLFYSEGVWDSANYGVGYATCTSAIGPCSTIQVASLLTSNSQRLGPGGESLFQDSSGNTWMVYAAWNGPTSNFSYASGDYRSMWLTQVTFSNGVPIVGGSTTPPPPSSPQVTSVSPSSGPTGGGTSVTISGSNLSGATSIMFGTIPAASFTTVSSNEITAVSPSGSIGTVDITVTSGSTTSPTSCADQFTYIVANGASPAGGASSSGNSSNGYRIVTSSGDVYGCGGDPTYGSSPSGTSNIAAITDTPDNGGYWLASTNGIVTAFGDAVFYGSSQQVNPSLPSGGSNSFVPVKPIVGILATSDGLGYWMVDSRGDVYAFGDAGFVGSSGQINPSLPAGGSNSFVPVKPIVGILATSDGKGYWMVAADGGVFAFGDAGFVGSIGSLTIQGSVIALVH